MAVERTLQTNGMLLDDEWCAFLAENDFLVGLSIDGPRELHDAYRHDAGGRPVFDRVVAAARRLRQHGVEFNVLCTVNAANAGHPLEVYRFFRDELGARFIQLIPIVEVETPPQDGRPGHGHRPQRAARGLRQLPERDLRRVGAPRRRRDVRADLRRRARRLRARDLEPVHLPARPAGRAPRSSTTATSTRATTSSIRRYLLGNITETPMGELVRSEQQRAFGRAKRDTLPAFCRSCEYLFACNGECPKNRILLTPDGEPGLNWLCAGLKAFFAHTERPMRLMADVLARGGEAREVMAILAEEARTTGRNDPCPCGSGKKYKRCCGIVAG